MPSKCEGGLRYTVPEVEDLRQGVAAETGGRGRQGPRGVSTTTPCRALGMRAGFGEARPSEPRTAPPSSPCASGRAGRPQCGERPPLGRQIDATRPTTAGCWSPVPTPGRAPSSRAGRGRARYAWRWSGVLVYASLRHGVDAEPRIFWRWSRRRSCWPRSSASGEQRETTA